MSLSKFTIAVLVRVDSAHSANRLSNAKPTTTPSTIRATIPLETSSPLSLARLSAWLNQPRPFVLRHSVNRATSCEVRYGPKTLLQLQANGRPRIFARHIENPASIRQQRPQRATMGNSAPARAAPKTMPACRRSQAQPTSRMKARIFSASLMPLLASTPPLTSTA